jgi:hypothetical protein
MPLPCTPFILTPQEYAEVLRSGYDRVSKRLKGIHDFLGGSSKTRLMRIRLKTVSRTYSCSLGIAQRHIVRHPSEGVISSCGNG